MSLKLEMGADNKILRTKSKPVKTITKKTLKFIKEMAESMIEEKALA